MQLSKIDETILSNVTPEFKRQPAFAKFLDRWSKLKGRTPDDKIFHALFYSDHIPDGNEIKSGLEKIRRPPISHYSRKSESKFGSIPVAAPIYF